MAKSKKYRESAIVGIAIPYYKNSAECEIKFKKLMQKIIELLNFNNGDKMLVYIYEDGQISDWLQEYKRSNIIIESCDKNNGVSYARNKCLDYLKDKCLYIAYIDSDDMLADDYFKKMYEYCADNTHDIIETDFWYEGQILPFLPKVKRCNVCGSAIKTNIIGKTRFDESLQIGEDTEFMNDVFDLNKHRKKHCPTTYYYQLGANPKSLTVSYQRKEIGKEFIKDGKRNN